MRQDEYKPFDRDSETYSDFLTDLNTHPVTKDVLRYVNENAIKRSIKNLILTNKYERLYKPKVYCGINSLLFEPMTDQTTESLKSIITDTINNYEPRCNLLTVEVVAKPNDNLYIVYVSFSLLNAEKATQMSINLYRVR